MNVYVDSSVLLRVVLGEPGRLRIWSKITGAVASEIVTVECLRTIDRARIHLRLADEDVADRRAAVLETIETFNLVPVGPQVLERAAEAFPTMLGSLDAIHLASALLVAGTFEDLSLATHDAVIRRSHAARIWKPPAVRGGRAGRKRQ